MKKLLFVAMLALSLSACGTIAGFGQDLESGGKLIQSGSKDVQEKL